MHPRSDRSRPSAEPFRYTIARFFGSLDPLPASVVFGWFVLLLLLAPVVGGVLVHATFGNLLLAATGAVLSLAATTSLIRDLMRWRFSTSSIMLVPATLLLVGLPWVLV